MSDDFLATHDKIKCKHDELFHLVDQAVRQEEEDHPQHALNLYKLAIDAIDETLAIPVKVPDNIDEVRSQWDEACRIIHKVKRARAELLQRVGILSEKLSKSETGNAFTAAASTVNNGTSGHSESRPRTYSELAQALREMKCTGDGIDSLELLFSCEGVKLYYVKPNGLVTTALEDSILRIVRMEKDDRKLLSATFFIQIIKSSEAVRIRQVEAIPSPSSEDNSIAVDAAEIGNWNSENTQEFASKSDNSWIYPLIPGVSPCYRTDYGAFILPDLEGAEPGASFGIVVPKDTGADEIVLEILEGILHGIVIQSRIEEGIPEGELSSRVSLRIVKGASYVSQNLVRGAEKAGELMTYSTPYLISKIRPASENPQPVSQNVRTTVEVAKNVSGAAAGITGYIAEKVGTATMALGRFLAPHIQTQGSRLLSKGFGMDEESAQQKMSDVLTIAAGAVEGFGTIYAGLEQSASVLGKNLSDNSVKIIGHKYGSSAGSLAAETFDTVGNVINLTQNVNSITPKALAKRTAKNAGKGIVQGYRPGVRSNETVPASALYPDLSGLQAEVKK